MCDCRCKPTTECGDGQLKSTAAGTANFSTVTNWQYFPIPSCDHDLDFCPSCNKVRCEKCGGLWYLTPYNPSPYPFWSSGTGGVTISAWTVSNGVAKDNGSVTYSPGYVTLT